MRPRIICHMVSSVDGRLRLDRWTPPVDGDRRIASRVYEQVAGRLDGQAWIIGRTSMGAIAHGVPRAVTPSGPFARTTHIGNRQGRKLAVGIDPHGKLHYGKDSTGDEHFVAVLGQQVSDAYLAELQEDGVSYLFAGRDGTDLQTAVETLGSDFGVETLLLEGGGVTNGAFLKAGLIDELSLLVFPGIDGLSAAPSIFEYQGPADDIPAAGLSLRHVHTEMLEGGMVWLRYRVERRA
jgi:riboflavin biosynthesis pyrimidine reductase